MFMRIVRRRLLMLASLCAGLCVISGVFFLLMVTVTITRFAAELVIPLALTPSAFAIAFSCAEVALTTASVVVFAVAMGRAVIEGYLEQL